MKAFKQKEKPTKRFSNSFGNNESKLSQFSGIGDSGHNPVIHKKLMIGEPNDKHEIEAENVANRVVNQPERTLQMQPIEEEEESLQLQPLEDEDEDEIQMQPNEDVNGEKLQMAPQESKVSRLEVSDSMTRELLKASGDGISLPKDVNNEMSQKIGHDFSDVSIHTNDRASLMSKNIGARAFTHGNDIYFNSGEYNPGTQKGKHLLAHELTHVVQQNGQTLQSNNNKLGKKVINRYPQIDNPQFWEDLRRDAVEYANDLVSNNDRAINQLARDLSGQENTSPSGAVAIDLIDFAMDIANATPAVKLGFKLLQRLYNQVSQVRSGSIQFAAFSRAVSTATQTLQDSIPNDWSEVNDSTPEVFQEIKALMESENDSNERSVRTQAVDLLRGANVAKPGYIEIMRKLIQAWVGGASDQRLREITIDLPDPDGFNTGYLRIYANIRVDTRLNYLSHRFTAISLDDIDLPDGTKQALITAWGQDFYLDELPFPGIIYLTMGRTIVVFRKTNSDATNDLEGWEPDVVNVSDRFRDSTIESRKRLYFDRIRPRIEHLRSND